MTLACNLQCKYCFEGHHDKIRYGEHKNYIDFETFKRYLDTVLYYRCVLGSVGNRIDWHFHGGEFLLIPWEELKKMFEYIEERKKSFYGLSYCVQTNGVALTDEMAQFFAERGDVVGFSFDGYDVNERFSSECAHALIDKFRRYYNEYGMKSSYLIVLTKNNMKTWIDDYRSCSDFIDEVSMNLLCEADHNNPNTPTIDEQWEYWYKPVLESYLPGHEIIHERNVSMIVEDMIQSLTYSSILPPKTGCFNRICAHGSNMTSLTFDGELSPCDKYAEDGKYISLKQKKNILDRDFLGVQNIRYIYNHHKAMFEEEKRLHCDYCPYNTACMGECQAYNLSKYGKYCIHEENVCEIYKRCYEFIENNWTQMLLNHKIKLNGIPEKILAPALKRINDEHLKIKYEDNYFWLEEGK